MVRVRSFASAAASSSDRSRCGIPLDIGVTFGRGYAIAAIT
jgi:hypothetical protein